MASRPGGVPRGPLPAQMFAQHEAMVEQAEALRAATTEARQALKDLNGAVKAARAQIRADIAAEVERAVTAIEIAARSRMISQADAAITRLADEWRARLFDPS